MTKKEIKEKIQKQLDCYGEIYQDHKNGDNNSTQMFGRWAQCHALIELAYYELGIKGLKNPCEQ